MEYKKKETITIGKKRGREAKINYDLYGDDNAPFKILFVMGFLQSGEAWKLQIDYFRKNKDFQICVYDNRGINNSTSFSLSLKEMAFDAVDLLDHLNWKNNINICGASLGGSIVTHICNIIPDRINSAIISAPHIGLFSPFISLGKKKFCKSFFIKNDREKYYTLISSIFSDEHLNSPSVSEPNKTKVQAMIDRAIKNKDKTPNPSIITLFSHLYIYISTKFTNKDFNNIRKNNINVLVLGGEKDVLIPLNCLKKDFVERLQTKNFKIFKTGHCINLEKPKDFNETISDHITKKNLNLQHYYNDTNSKRYFNFLSIKRFLKFK
ncbi:hypothetical protein DICPUDRAFT_156481 [Dictyostelium purpureum]|uniref:AB hydrolase-1 domain-containing protein n=1 Tax=Dictyostelium purpureum TaxID=5786 RepID=F0ZWP3_DICPU|nr:uncharacterized protein DICPUDRAFT_156481 [Dictyostelium purpureum]EGC31641.1 hypothetical protein DICPUDRAFT_156481 [Dictyostelium purpureum]|eukprot:XP_003291839.1 hypothetical protein DICPUDRAFT_156481 [Dictyostelium purpureum]